MSADPKFLDSLKPGDKFVLRTRRLDTFGRKHGPEIYEVVKIPPKRGKFTVKKIGQGEVEFDIKGHGGMRVGASFSAEFFQMEPHTPAIDVEIKQNSNLILAKNRAYRLQEKLRIFEQRANDLSIEQIQAFLDNSKPLRGYLDTLIPTTEV